MESFVIIFLFSFFIICIFGYISFIVFLGVKIGKLEQKIENLFLERTNLIPSIFEVSKHFLTKHDDIFKEIIILRKKEFNAKENNVSFPEFIQTETNLHHELNFIFRVCNQHQKLLKDGKFLYIRDLLIERSMGISEKMILYKNIVKKYRWHSKVSKFLLIGLLISPKEIQEI